MAIWQYTFQILYKDSAAALSPQLFFESGNDGFDEEIYWKQHSIARETFQDLSSFLGKSSSWSDEIELYGNQDSTCVEVYFEETNSVVSASLRIDFREDYLEVLNKIVNFCTLNGFILLDEKLEVVPLNVEAIKGVIEASAQVRKYNDLLG